MAKTLHDVISVYKGHIGINGRNGCDGINGITFIPRLKNGHILSWTNDGNLANPPDFDLAGEIAEVYVNDTLIEIEDGKLVIPVPEKTSELENDSDFTTNEYVQNNYYNKTESDSQYATKEALAQVKEIADNAYHYKGTVATYNDLPTTGNHIGDVWNVGNNLNGPNYAWTGSTWDRLGELFSFDTFVKKDEALESVNGKLTCSANTATLKLTSTKVNGTTTEQNVDMGCLVNQIHEKADLDEALKSVTGSFECENVENEFVTKTDIASAKVYIYAYEISDFPLGSYDVDIANGEFTLKGSDWEEALHTFNSYVITVLEFIDTVGHAYRYITDDKFSNIFNDESTTELILEDSNYKVQILNRTELLSTDDNGPDLLAHCKLLEKVSDTSYKLYLTSTKTDDISTNTEEIDLSCISEITDQKITKATDPLVGIVNGAFECGTLQPHYIADAYINGYNDAINHVYGVDSSWLLSYSDAKLRYKWLRSNTLNHIIGLYDTSFNYYRVPIVSNPLWEGTAPIGTLFIGTASNSNHIPKFIVLKLTSVELQDDYGYFEYDILSESTTFTLTTTKASGEVSEQVIEMTCLNNTIHNSIAEVTSSLIKDISGSLECTDTTATLNISAKQNNNTQISTSIGMKCLVDKINEKTDKTVALASVDGSFSCSGTTSPTLTLTTKTASNTQATKTINMSCINTVIQNKIDDALDPLNLSTQCVYTAVQKEVTFGLAVSDGDGDYTNMLEISGNMGATSIVTGSYSIRFGADGAGGLALSYPYMTSMPYDAEDRGEYEFFRDAVFWMSTRNDEEPLRHYIQEFSDGVTADVWIEQSSTSGYHDLYLRAYGPKAQNVPRSFTLKIGDTVTRHVVNLTDGTSTTLDVGSTDVYIYPRTSVNTRLYRSEYSNYYTGSEEYVKLTDGVPYTSEYLAPTFTLNGTVLTIAVPTNNVSSWIDELASATLTLTLGELTATASLNCLVSYISTALAGIDDTLSTVNTRIANAVSDCIETIEGSFDCSIVDSSNNPNPTLILSTTTHNGVVGTVEVGMGCLLNLFSNYTDSEIDQIFNT